MARQENTLQAGTLLSDLDGSQGGSNDNDIVNKILSELNSSNGQRGAPPPPPMPQQQPTYYQQMPATSAPVTMDSRIPTAHIIGNEHPTPADFAAAVAGAQRPMEPQGFIGAPVGMMPGYQQQQMPQQYYEPSKSFTSKVLEEIKVPFVVAFLFFLFSLPPFRILISHYIPSLLKPTGEFTVVGLLSTSGIVALTFWILQRVIAPLLSL
jgi:hypothetical protein